MSALIPAPSRPASPLELAVRRWYGSWLEPLLRWLPDRGQRVVWWLRRTRLVDAVSRPADRQPRISLEVAAPYISADDRRYISSVVHAKIPVSGLTESWNLVGAEVSATWTIRKRPPRAVGVEHLVANLDRLPDDSLYLGQGAAGPVTVSLADDSPHVAVSAGSGAGKSTLALLIATQILHRGGSVIVIDRKGSHRALRDLEGVTYCTRPAAMHESLLWAAQVADERNTAAFDQSEGWDPGPRILVLCEELNSTVAQLRSHWDAVREPGGTRVSPAIAALGEISHMGRAAKVHLLAVAQQLSARAVGGGEARENFSVRCLARFSSNSWKMLAPQASMPVPSRVRGRWHVVVGSEVQEVQVAYLRPVEARQLASVPGRANPLDRPLTRNVPGDGAPTGDSPPALLSISDALAEGLLVGSKDMIKKRLLRDPNRPQPVGKRGRQTLLYAREDLVSWASG
jgi:hypothetical protein